MKISLLGGQQSFFRNLQSAMPVSSLWSKAGQANPRTDRVTIKHKGEPVSQQQSGDYLSGLIEYKEVLRKRRIDLLTKDYDTDLEFSIAKEQAKELSKQLQQVEQQIQDYLFQQQKAAVEEQRKKPNKEEQESTPEQAQQRQMHKLHSAMERIDRAQELGPAKAVLERSAAHQQEWAEENYSLTAAVGESVSSNLQKLQAGIEGLQASQDALYAEAKELIQEAASGGKPSHSEPAAGEKVEQDAPSADQNTALKRQEEEEEDGKPKQV